jgi:hypothetical protein
MKRLSALPILLLATAGFGSHRFGPTPQEILAKQYKDFNSYILKSDSKGISAWVKNHCAAKFAYTSYQKNKYNRDGYLQGLIQQMTATTKVLKSTLTVRAFDRKADKIVATVATDFKGIVVFDTRRLNLTDQSVSYDTWILSGKEWKLQSVVQVNADTQMQQDDGN